MFALARDARAYVIARSVVRDEATLAPHASAGVSNLQSPLPPGLLLLLLGLIQPLYVLVAWAAMGAHAATLLLTGQRAAVRAAVRAAPAIGLLSAPMVSYTALAFALDPALRQWGAQNVIRSPHPLHYLLAYGLLLIPAAVGLRRLWRRDRFRAAFLAGWVAVLPLLLYAPYNLNRRFAEGFFAALAALAVLGLWPPSLRLRPLLPSSFFPPSSSSLSSSSREAFLLPAKRSFFLPSSSFLLPSSFFL
ncbi:MAG: hypothetical protein HY784_02120, partial [Chloroflexi bacterium]|nr:hypothetical protein [Chloroflexota bacterium]